MITTEERDTHSRFEEPGPCFGVAPSSLLEGLKHCPDLEVHVITCVRQPVAMPETIANNIFCHAVMVPRWGFLRTAYLPCIIRIRRLLRRIRPCLVHGQGTERYCALAAVWSGYPNLVTLHGNMAELSHSGNAPVGSYLWLAARLEDIALKRAQGVLCNSRHTEKMVRPRTKQTWLVPNAVREVFFSRGSLDTPRSPTRLLNVGSVCENKQQLELMRVARTLWQRGLDFRVDFVGTTDTRTGYGQRFEAEAAQAEQEGFAHYVGSKGAEELVSYFDAAGALVHTPVSESFGLVVAEALARNLKLFGFRVGGIPDVAEGAADAVLIQPNDWAGLTDAIAAWLKSGSPRPAATLDLMRTRYHHDAVAQQHEQIYRSILFAFRCGHSSR